jgi:hypothetical protein
MTRFLFVLVLATSTARADTPRETPAAIEVDRFEGPPGRSELGFDGGAPLKTWAVALGASWLEQPITLDDTLPVRRRQTGSLGGAIALGGIVLDGRLGLSHQIGDRLRAFDDTTKLARFALGDLRLGGRIHVTGSAARSAFVRLDLTLPTGDDDHFAGEAGWSVAWRLIGRVMLPHDIVFAATAGIRLRGIEVLVGDRVVGSELVGAAGIVVPLPPIRPLWCVAEQVKLSGEVVAILGDDVGGERGPSPVEARIGVVTQPLPWLQIGVRAGTGLADQLGAPRLRALLELTYVAP